MGGSASRIATSTARTSRPRRCSSGRSPRPRRRRSPPPSRRSPEMAVTKVRRMDLLRDSISPFMDFFTGPFAKLNANPEIANFAVGNPQDYPLTAYVEPLRTHVEPQRRDWFAYKDSEPKSRIAVARSL